MKAINSKFSKAFLGLAVLSSTFAGAIANDAVLNSDPININGYVQEAPATDHELETVKNQLNKVKREAKVNKVKAKTYKKLAKETEDLSEVTEEMIEDRKESQATMDKYNKKIECLMQENPGKDCDEYVRGKSDSVSTGQAAPAKTAATVEADTLQLGNVIKVLPYAGMTAIQSENEELEANVAAGIRVESDITASFSIGLGFNYTSLTTTDFANGYGGFTPDYYRGYTSTYGAGRELEYKNMNFDIYSKYFFTKTSRFRPYLGAGIAYNRVTMKYTDNRNFNTSGFNNVNRYQFGDEELTTNSISARLMGGSEILFTKNIGMNLELQYSRGLGDGFGDQERVAESPDFRRMRELNNEINDANIFSVFAGVLVLF